MITDTKHEMTQYRQVKKKKFLDSVQIIAKKSNHFFVSMPTSPKNFYANLYTTR